MTAKRAPKAEKRTNPRGVLPRKEEGTIGGKQEDPIVPRFPSSASSSTPFALPASCQKSQASSLSPRENEREGLRLQGALQQAEEGKRISFSLAVVSF
uniref:Uncharacterized protein n=1 Tax=Nymphaea colorata TaxID=210225 RepID=A0A5K1ACN5_9MAGN